MCVGTLGCYQNAAKRVNRPFRQGVHSVSRQNLAKVGTNLRKVHLKFDLLAKSRRMNENVLGIVLSIS
jgi:hypothetical protein